MVFPGAGPVPRHPSQLYEAFFEGAVLFAVLWWLTCHRSALRRPGLTAGAFLIGYGLARSFCELFREPEVDHILNIGPLTAGIVYCLPMIAAGILMVRWAVPAAADAQR
jgi:phosphatidylglycerol:prolipoprotein diacylglycerol transferase